MHGSMRGRWGGRPARTSGLLYWAFTDKDADHTLWRTALMTGMRRGELLGLRRRDLLLDD